MKTHCRTLAGSWWIFLFSYEILLFILKDLVSYDHSRNKLFDKYFENYGNSLAGGLNRLR
ncbi:MAG: hypothetical protein ACOZFS_05220 [Thermodesulfobacteriota bacterium]